MRLPQPPYELPQPPYGYQWGKSKLWNCDLQQVIGELEALNTIKDYHAWMVQNGYLIPHMREQAIMRAIKLLRESGLTYTRIVEELVKMRGHLPERLLQYCRLAEKMDNEKTWSLGE